LHLAPAVPTGIACGRYFILRVQYADGKHEEYVLPLAIIEAPNGARAEGPPPVVLAAFGSGHLLADAYTVAEFRSELLTFFHTPDERQGTELTAKIFRDPEIGASAATRLLGVEQSNTSVTIGDRLWLKLYRRFENGIHPEEEMLTFLQQGATFGALPGLYAALEITGNTGQGCVGLLMERIANDGDGWKYTLRLLSHCFQSVLEADSPVLEGELLGLHCAEASTNLAIPLGALTGELHLALAAGHPNESHFAPEPLTATAQRDLCQRLRSHAETILGTLEQSTNSFPVPFRQTALQLLSRRADIFGLYDRLSEEELGGCNIRVHGDLHLAQVLYQPPQFVFIDFEGPPAAPLADRRAKRSALVDVASMLRSFDFAAALALHLQPPAARRRLAPHAQAWSQAVSQSFLAAYFQSTRDADFLPHDSGHRHLLLSALLLDKAIYELGYELSYRPDWAIIPLAAISRLLSEL
jgi:maltose alpha-D-glucosyltransferase/alpha-amylase